MSVIISSQLIFHSLPYPSIETSVNPSLMKYDTIEDGESTPLQEGGYSDDGTSTSAAPNTTNKHTRSTIVRILMVGTTVGTLLLMITGHSKMMARYSNVDGMVAVSSTARHPPGTPTGTPSLSTYNVSFRNGREGWYTSNNDVLRAEGSSANPNFYLHADLFSWGISFQNSVHHKFVGDFFEKGVVELGLDMRVNSILYNGFEIASHLVLTLEDDTGVGVYFTSERDLERDTAMTRPVFSTFSFSIPLQEDFPTGWKGYDTGVNPPFPAGRTYGSVLRNVQRISFTTYQPGMDYGEMRFDIDADNVFISSKENV